LLRQLLVHLVQLVVCHLSHPPPPPPPPPPNTQYHPPPPPGPLLLQGSLESLDLLLEFAQHGVLWVLIDARLVLDVLCAVGIAQGRACLIIVVISRPKVGHHDSLGVTSEGVLQKTGELGIAIGDVARLRVHERGNDVAQSRE
jgi:hypothetical protein